MADRTPQEKLQEIVKKYDAGEYYLDTANIIREAFAVAAEIAREHDVSNVVQPGMGKVQACKLLKHEIADAMLAAVKELK